MTELELLQELEKRFRKMLNDKRAKRNELRNNLTATHNAYLLASAKFNGAGDMYCVFSNFYEELGYSDEQVWQRKNN